MKPNLQNGQRWLWADAENKFLAEIIDQDNGKAKVLETTGCVCFAKNEIFVIATWLSPWQYLEGQDKINERN